MRSVCMAQISLLSKTTANIVDGVNRTINRGSFFILLLTKYLNVTNIIK